MKNLCRFISSPFQTKCWFLALSRIILPFLAAHSLAASDDLTWAYLNNFQGTGEAATTTQLFTVGEKIPKNPRHRALSQDLHDYRLGSLYIINQDKDNIFRKEVSTIRLKKEVPDPLASKIKHIKVRFDYQTKESEARRAKSSSYSLWSSMNYMAASAKTTLTFNRHRSSADKSLEATLTYWILAERATHDVSVEESGGYGWFVSSATFGGALKVTHTFSFKSKEDRESFERNFEMEGSYLGFKGGASAAEKEIKTNKIASNSIKTKIDLYGTIKRVEETNNPGVKSQRQIKSEQQVLESILSLLDNLARIQEIFSESDTIISARLSWTGPVSHGSNPNRMALQEANSLLVLLKERLGTYSVMNSPLASRVTQYKSAIDSLLKERIESEGDIQTAIEKRISFLKEISGLRIPSTARFTKTLATLKNKREPQVRGPENINNFDINHGPIRLIVEAAVGFPTRDETPFAYSDPSNKPALIGVGLKFTSKGRQSGDVVVTGVDPYEILPIVPDARSDLYKELVEEIGIEGWTKVTWENGFHKSLSRVDRTFDRPRSNNIVREQLGPQPKSRIFSIDADVSRNASLVGWAQVRARIRIDCTLGIPVALVAH